MNVETVVFVGMEVAAFVCGFAVCAWLVRREFRETMKERSDARDAVRIVFQACREKLNDKTFERVRRRSLEISEEMDEKRKGRGK